MSKQVMVWKTTDPPLTNTTEFIHPLQSGNVFGPEAQQSIVISTAGTFSNLRVVLSAAPGVGKSWVVTLRKNGSNTALTVTISGTSTDVSDVTNSVSVAVGDLVSLSFAPSGTPTAMSPSVSVDFDSTTPATSIYGGSSANIVSLTRFTALFGGSSSGNWSGDSGINAVEGDLTRLDVSLDGDPISGSYTFNIEKNGVIQDGTGGTVNTTVTISAGSTTGNATFSLSCSPLDLFRLRVVPSGVGTTRRPRFGVAMVADTPGDSNYYGSAGDNTDSAATEYNSFGTAGNTWNGTESTQQATLGSALSLNFIAAVFNLAPGAGRSYTITVRQNGGDTGLAATVADTNTTGSGSAAISFAAGDLINVKMAPSGSPPARQVFWACSMHIPDPVTGRSYGYIF